MGLALGILCAWKLVCACMGIKNPKGGTVLMKQDIATSLDLPLRVAVYKDQMGKVWLSYHNPQDLKANYDVAGGAKVLNTVEGALDKLTTAVTK